MSKEILKLRSSVKPELLRSVLFRGTFVAGAGAALLFFAGASMPVSLLQFWGFPLFCIAFLLIALGLLPYRRLKKLERNPDEIVVVDDDHFVYLRQRKPLFMLPFSAIEKMEYYQSDKYGIKIWLKPNFDMKSYQKKSRREMNCDLFLPYFSKSRFLDLCSFKDSLF